MHYRRLYIPGATYFFTLVAYNRQKIFSNSENIQLLKKSIITVKNKHPFTIDAIVVLPEHMHFLLTLPDEDQDFSTRIRLVKSEFSRKCTTNVGWVKNELCSFEPNKSRLLKQEKHIWQRRFWEHLIRNEKDFESHMNYIHYNPVKHGLAASPKDWQYSSFHHCVTKGFYNISWGSDITEHHFDKIIQAE